MALTEIARALTVQKGQILRESNLSPHLADELNLALAHLNDSIQTVERLAAVNEPQLQVSSDAQEALAEVERLRAELAAARGEVKIEDVAGEATEDWVKEPAPSPPTPVDAIRTERGLDTDVTSEQLAGASRDLFGGEGVDPNAALPLGDPAAVAREQAIAANFTKHRFNETA